MLKLETTEPPKIIELSPLDENKFHEFMFGGLCFKNAFEVHFERLNLNIQEPYLNHKGLNGFDEVN